MTSKLLLALLVPAGALAQTREQQLALARKQLEIFSRAQLAGTVEGALPCVIKSDFDERYGPQSQSVMGPETEPA